MSPRHEKNKCSVLNMQGEEDPWAQICKGKQPRWDYAPFSMTFLAETTLGFLSFQSCEVFRFIRLPFLEKKKLKVSCKCFAIPGADRKSQKQLAGVGKGSSSVEENLP